MIDFATLQGLTIPEGVVTQIEDEVGRVIWSCGKPVILEVEKIIDRTYSGGTTYRDEEFILLDISPKPYGTVKVTYGGLTKTITNTSGSAYANSQSVFFGTLYGVSDEVETPSSGTLTIEGNYNTFKVGSYNYDKNASSYCSCITSVIDWGSVTYIENYSFYGCNKLTNIVIPYGVPSIGYQAFRYCTSLISITIPDSVTSIYDYAFFKCESLKLSELPSGIERIGESAFSDCNNLEISEIPEGVTVIGAKAFYISNAAAKMFRGKITLPSTLQKISYTALSAFFSGAGGVRDYFWHFAEITVLATTPPTLVADETITIYDNYINKLIVPKGCSEAYKTAEGWANFADYIVEAL